jgi:hypothetical protein
MVLTYNLLKSNGCVAIVTATGVNIIVSYLLEKRVNNFVNILTLASGNIIGLEIFIKNYELEVL